MPDRRPPDRSAPPGMPERRFAQHDLNRDGRVTREEMAQATRAHRNKQTD